MKEATGELNMTVITVVAIAAVAGIFYVFVRPSLKGSITGTMRCNSAYGCTCDGSKCTCAGYFGDDGTAVEGTITCDDTTSGN